MAYSTPVYDPTVGWEIWVYDQITHVPIRQIGNWSGLTYVDQLNDTGTGQVTLNLDDQVLFPKGDTSLIDGEHFWQIRLHGIPVFVFCGEDVVENMVQASGVATATVSGRGPLKLFEDAIVLSSNFPTTPPAGLVTTGVKTAWQWEAYRQSFLTRAAAPFRAPTPPVIFARTSGGSYTTVGYPVTQTMTEGVDLLTVLKNFTALGSLEFRFDPLAGWRNPTDPWANLGQLVIENTYYPDRYDHSAPVALNASFLQGGNIAALSRSRTKRALRTQTYYRSAGFAGSWGISDGTMVTGAPGNPPTGLSTWEYRETFLNDSSSTDSATGNHLANAQATKLATVQVDWSLTANLEQAQLGLSGPIPGVTYGVGDNAIIWYQNNTSSATMRILQLAVAVDNANGNGAVAITCGEPIVPPGAAVFAAMRRIDGQFRLNARRNSTTLTS